MGKITIFVFFFDGFFGVFDISMFKKIWVAGGGTLKTLNFSILKNHLFFGNFRTVTVDREFHL